MSLSADEIVDIVDENNQVIRQECRAVMRRDKLAHRSTYIFAKNSKGQFYIQKRTIIKDYCPGYYEVVSGGVVGAGETYEENAYRELEEELGIKGVPLDHLFTFYYEDERLKVFGDCWECTYDGELTLQPEEVVSVHPMTLEEVFARVEAGDKFTPDSLVAARHYITFKKGTLHQGIPESMVSTKISPETLFKVFKKIGSDGTLVFAENDLTTWKLFVELVDWLEEGSGLGQELANIADQIKMSWDEYSGETKTDLIIIPYIEEFIKRTSVGLVE